LFPLAANDFEAASRPTRARKPRNSSGFTAAEPRSRAGRMAAGPRKSVLTGTRTRTNFGIDDIGARRPQGRRLFRVQTLRRIRFRNPASRRRGEAAFTLVELLVVVAIIAILAALTGTAMAKAKGKAHALTCLSNCRQLTLAALLYATDTDDQFPYNLGGSSNNRGIAPRADYNWVNNILDWEVENPDNTNLVFVTKGRFSQYAGRTARIYRCPSDHALSERQKLAGWTGRVRSYSMNAMVGDAGDNSRYGTNVFNPGYTQFKKTTQIPSPTSIFVFVDEHPDSINDGYFLNRLEELEWLDLPASYHNGAAMFSFADGHMDGHRWTYASTQPPPKPTAAGLPLPVEADARSDYDWVVRRTAVEY
jgi:prepilin-type N-terminal cleavage/methylation domain-containing protein/prepilin-type processing-associated H-X9-DG protein